MENIIDVIDAVIRVKNSAYTTNSNDIVTDCDSILRKIVASLKDELEK